MKTDQRNPATVVRVYQLFYRKIHGIPCGNNHHSAKPRGYQKKSTMSGWMGKRTLLYAVVLLAVIVAGCTGGGTDTPEEPTTPEEPRYRDQAVREVDAAGQRLEKLSTSQSPVVDTS